MLEEEWCPLAIILDDNTELMTRAELLYAQQKQMESSDTLPTTGAESRVCDDDHTSHNDVLRTHDESYQSSTWL